MCHLEIKIEKIEKKTKTKKQQHMTINGNKCKFIRINKGRNNIKCKLYIFKNHISI